MGSKREEERNEKIIRGLMKLPPNRRCINCNSLVLYDSSASLSFSGKKWCLDAKFVEFLPFNLFSCELELAC